MISLLTLITTVSTSCYGWQFYIDILLQSVAITAGKNYVKRETDGKSSKRIYVCPPFARNRHIHVVVQRVSIKVHQLLRFVSEKQGLA